MLPSEYIKPEPGRPIRDTPYPPPPIADFNPAIVINKEEAAYKIERTKSKSFLVEMVNGIKNKINKVFIAVSYFTAEYNGNSALK
ncbi:hypothetical protein KUL118_04520 [Tenacibaculum sp. KUL118]|nr:hypothetical protein KUL118_04520 [Tenacibaculum sp. KUL118]